MTDLHARAMRYRAAAAALHNHLDNHLSPTKGYPDQPSWGYAFSLLLSAAVGQGTLSPFGQHAMKQLTEQNQSHPNYSWEFVVYAVQQAKRLLQDSIALPSDELRAKGTRMLNWFLLRQVNRGWFDCNKFWTLLKVRVAVRLYTTPQGQILDEFKTRSLQYHAFCLFLLCELLEQYPDTKFLKRQLQQGATFSASLVLEDGCALWLGRGQEQIFGYGALLYALEYVHLRVAPLPDPTVLSRLADHVLKHQRADGSFPLVLRHREAEPANTCFAAQPLGWYGYNTLYDYQPFLGYMLWRCAQLSDVL